MALVRVTQFTRLVPGVRGGCVCLEGPRRFHSCSGTLAGMAINITHLDPAPYAPGTFNMGSPADYPDFEPGGSGKETASPCRSETGNQPRATSKTVCY